MHHTQTPQKQRCYLVVRAYPDGTREIVADHESEKEAREDAMSLAAAHENSVFVVYKPEDAYAAAPRVAHRVYLDWPERPPVADPPPPPEMAVEEGAAAP